MLRLAPEETAEHRVEAAVAVCQAGDDRKNVKYGWCRKCCPRVPGKTLPECPESDCMVGKPAEDEGSHQDTNRAGCPATVEACVTADTVEKPAAAGS